MGMHVFTGLNTINFNVENQICVFQTDGSVMATTIVVITQMKKTAITTGLLNVYNTLIFFVKTKECVSQSNGCVMAIAIVLITQMKKTAITDEIGDYVPVPEHDSSLNEACTICKVV
ncbi:uncharacterized protein [Argopecten irradians]|uniref:uncharacterized protein isoform X2 n=1 Tax=Argopecten irradians TaxID=31199 RepID=UPI00371B47BB